MLSFTEDLVYVCVFCLFTPFLFFVYHEKNMFIRVCQSISCSEHIAGGVNIYSYGCVSLLVLVCTVCLCVCAISNLSTIKKPHK